MVCPAPVLKMLFLHRQREEATQEAEDARRETRGESSQNRRKKRGEKRWLRGEGDRRYMARGKAYAAMLARQRQTQKCII